MSRKRRRRNPRHDARRVAVLPTLVTLMNAVCGFAAIHFTARGMNDPEALWLSKPPLTFFAAAGYMIFLAMLADALDGQVARLSGSTSGFGAQLDSLADMVSFGVAPAFLMLRVVESSFQDVIGPAGAGPAFGGMLGKLLWLLAAAYVCCAALRLARFNVETSSDLDSHMYFSGLPSPAAAGVVASLVVLASDLLPEFHLEAVRASVGVVVRVVTYTLAPVTLAVALLMVSRIPYRHVLNHYLRGRRPFGHVVRLVLVALLLIWKPQFTMALAFNVYAGSGIVVWLWRHYVRRRHVGRPDSPPATKDETTAANPPPPTEPQP